MVRAKTATRRQKEEDENAEDPPTFSTIRTPSSYPASQKRYLRGSRADLPEIGRPFASDSPRPGFKSVEMTHHEKDCNTRV
jgi:hypothetical protein